MRFENRLNKENLKINTLNPCCDDEEGIASYEELIGFYIEKFPINHPSFNKYQDKKEEWIDWWGHMIKK